MNMIPQTKKILYATDLSRNSAYAFYYAVDMAQQKGATIVILHTIEPLPAYIQNYIGETEWTKLDRHEEMIALIEKRFQSFCQKVDAQIGSPCVDLVSKIIVRVGNAVDEILSVSDEEKCDMIILGNHGKGFLKQTFLGSVSRAVLDRTHKPVLIIPLPPDSVNLDWATI
jgi:nucleotide-binding universal stress UspA family protein